MRIIKQRNSLESAFSEIDADLDSIEAKVKKLHAQHMKRGKQILLDLW